jgi:hypothetical protein
MVGDLIVTVVDDVTSLDDPDENSVIINDRDKILVSCQSDDTVDIGIDGNNLVFFSSFNISDYNLVRVSEGESWSILDFPK